MNLPNKLTVLRIIMVPFFVFFMLTDVGGEANKWIALILFCVASLTDMLDRKSQEPGDKFWKVYGSFGGQASGLLCHDMYDPVRAAFRLVCDRDHCP